MASLPPRFNQLAAARRRTLEMTEKVDQVTSERRPAKCSKLLGEAGTWSIGEILDHILRVFRSLVGEIEVLYDLDAKGESTVLRRTLKDYDVAPALVPKSLMSILEPGFQLANVVSDAILPPRVRDKILRNRSFPIQNPKKWLPAAGREIAELRGELQSSLSDLEALLQRDTQKPLEELVLSHTVFGRHSVPELLSVLEVHESWHQKDLEARAAE